MKGKARHISDQDRTNHPQKLDSRFKEIAIFGPENVFSLTKGERQYVTSSSIERGSESEKQGIQCKRGRQEGEGHSRAESQPASKKL